MRELERASAVFCMACICAELASRFVGQGWGRKCIKAAAGLYILVVLTETLSGANPQILLSSLPQPESAALGTMEEAVLAQTESELETVLEDRCLQETGIAVTLDISLIQEADRVRADTVRIQHPGNLNAAERQRITDTLTAQLQVSPECLIWETPDWEGAP